MIAAMPDLGILTNGMPITNNNNSNNSISYTLVAIVRPFLFKNQIKNYIVYNSIFTVQLSDKIKKNCVSK